MAINGRNKFPIPFVTVRPAYVVVILFFSLDIRLFELMDFNTVIMSVIDIYRHSGKLTHTLGGDYYAGNEYIDPGSAQEIC